MIKWAFLFLLVVLVATVLGDTETKDSITASIANVVIDTVLVVVLLLTIIFGATFFKDQEEQ